MRPNLGEGRAECHKIGRDVVSAEIGATFEQQTSTIAIENGSGRDKKGQHESHRIAQDVPLASADPFAAIQASYSCGCVVSRDRLTTQRRHDARKMGDCIVLPGACIAPLAGALQPVACHESVTMTIPGYLNEEGIGAADNAVRYLAACVIGHTTHSQIENVVNDLAHIQSARFGRWNRIQEPVPAAVGLI